MSKFQKRMKKIGLVLIFTFLVFGIMFVTMLLSFLCLILLFHFELLHIGEFSFIPIFIFIVISLLLGILISLTISHRPLRPIRTLTEASNKIAAGDYSVRIDLKGSEEFEQLTDSFNHMAEELTNVELLRNDFVNNFSHEFKTPIVSIRGFAKMLQRTDLTPEERREYLDIIIDESERLAAMATNVLNLTKLEHQVILTDETRFNISEQLRIVITMIDSKWKDKNIAFTFDSNEIYLRGNEELLKQVWVNLLDNAVKFSNTDGTVEIRLNQIDATVICSITNYGKSIPKENATHIFDKFYQADASHTTAGNGLGLTICKRIVELHDGSIELSENTEQAITFTILLPVK